MKSYREANIQSCHVAWDYFPEHSAFKRWANQLTEQANSTFERCDWEMLGHGVLIESGDTASAIEAIRHAAKYADIQFIDIEPASVPSAFPDWFTSYCREGGSDTPTVVLLRPGIWMTPANGDLPEDERFAPYPGADADEEAKFRRYLAQLLNTEISNRPIVLVTVIKSHSQLDFELRKPRLFDRKISLPVLATDDEARLFIDQMGPQNLDDDLQTNLVRLGHFLKAEFEDPRRRDLMVVALKRRSWSEKRKIRFSDLVEMSLYGTTECDAREHNEVVNWRSAVHEAGHVLMSYLISGRKVVPEYCSIVSKNEMLGVAIENYENQELKGDDHTFSDYRNIINILMGGRIAEHIILGKDAMSTAGSRGDIRKITNLSRKLVESYGIGLADNRIEETGGYLLSDSEELSAASKARNECHIRQFLNEEYEKCYRLMQNNVSELKMLAQELKRNKYLVQENIRKILASQ